MTGRSPARGTRRPARRLRRGRGSPASAASTDRWTPGRRRPVPPALGPHLAGLLRGRDVGAADVYRPQGRVVAKRRRHHVWFVVGAGRGEASESLTGEVLDLRCGQFGGHTSITTRPTPTSDQTQTTVAPLAFRCCGSSRLGQCVIP